MTDADLIAELKLCLVDMFEAEDKFYVLSLYINDQQAKTCAESRVRWFQDSARRIENVLKKYEEQKNDKDRV